MAAEPLPPVLVLRGGPDRERPVSLKSGGAVAVALREAGLTVEEADVSPDDLSALDMFLDRHPEGVVFPVLHGPWGEGGPLQHVLEARGCRFVGCGSVAAADCMDKARAKELAASKGVATPRSEVITSSDVRTLRAPVAIKALSEGSSFGVRLARDEHEAQAAAQDLLGEFDRVLVEVMVDGPELTIGVIEDPTVEGGLRVLPPIRVVPATVFYDFAAKYDRNDTQYCFDLAEAEAHRNTLCVMAVQAFRALGCRHLARIDFMVDKHDGPLLIEANTMPGFTDHSLLPKAAAKAGMPFGMLCRHLVGLATV